MSAEFTVVGAKEIGQQARAARRHLDLGQDLVLRDLADLFRKGERDVFVSQGAAIASRWKPLAAASQKARARLNSKFGLGIGPSSPVLVLFGDLRAALTEKGGAQNQRIGSHTLEITVSTDRINRHDRRRGLGMTLTKKGRRRKPSKGGNRYPNDIIEIHEKGTGRIPARRVIGIPGYVHFEMERRVKGYLDRVLRSLAGESVGA